MKKLTRLYTVMELFSNCTSASIAAFSKDGEFLLDYGLFKCYLFLRNDKRLMQSIALKLAEKISSGEGRTVNEPWVVKKIDDAELAFCLMDPKDKNSGFFLIAPSPKYRNKIPYDLRTTISYLIGLLRIIEKDVSGKKPAVVKTDQVYSFHVQKAVDYIHSFYYEEITLESMASRLGLNKSYFASIFKKETGQTFTQMLQNVRIENSKKPLEDGTGSILDVALAVGFTSQNYFATVFKKATGMTPRQYRQKLS